MDPKLLNFFLIFHQNVVHYLLLETNTIDYVEQVEIDQILQIKILRSHKIEKIIFFG